MRYLILTFVLLACATTVQAKDEVIYTPDSSLKYAMGDLASIDVKLQPYIRYLSLYNVPAEKRDEYATTVSFVVNSLSRRKKIYIPVYVGASNKTVIRINLNDYQIDPKVWEELGRKGSGTRAFPEPYFHAFADRVVQDLVEKQTQVPTGRTLSNGYPEYRIVIEKIPVKTVRIKELRRAPWIDAVTYELMYKATHSEFPIFRADWFVVNAMVEPIYHQFLGIGEDEKSFDKVVFADDALAEKAGLQTKGVVVKSQVARNNRTMLRSPTFAGYKWKTRDALKSTDDKTYVQNFLDEKFDASEIIASLPNGLQAYLVTDGQGKRQDKADNEVATDYMAADKIVRTGRSCVYCHMVGINPIQDEIRTLNKRLQNREQVMLLVVSEKDQYRIEDLFGTNLDQTIVLDQNIYSSAIGLATGLSAKDNAERFHSQWEGYVENLMTMEQIAADCGMSVMELNKLCRLSNDNLFLGLIQNPIRPVRRDHFEQAFQTFMILAMRARAGEKPGVAPTIILEPDRIHKSTNREAGERVQMIRECKVYKPGAEESCGSVSEGSVFDIIRTHENLSLISTKTFGNVWVETKDVKKFSEDAK